MTVYYKMRQVFYCKMRQLLQNATNLLQNATVRNSLFKKFFFSNYKRLRLDFFVNLILIFSHKRRGFFMFL